MDNPPPMKADPESIKRCLRETNALEGDLAEVGVYLGGSAEWILQLTDRGALYLYDTFNGMPAEMCTKGEHHQKGSLKGYPAEKIAKKLDKYDGRFVIREGIFPATADDGIFRFVHVDCDTYLSTKAALEWFAPRMVFGGIMLVDDYLCSSTPGAKKAVDEFMSSGGRSSFMMEVFGHRCIIKNVRQEALA